MTSQRISWERLYEIRQQMKLTQKELAYLCGVHLNTIKAWESPPECKNHRRMTPQYATQIQAIYSRFLRREVL